MHNLRHATRAARHARRGRAGTGRPPEHQRELFGLRLDRWWADLHDGLTAVYGADRAVDLERRLVRHGGRRRSTTRDPDLHRLDLQRTLDPGWFQDESMLGYAATPSGSPAT